MNNELLKYSLQLSMLSMLLSKHLLSDIEYKKIKIKLAKFQVQISQSVKTL